MNNSSARCISGINSKPAHKIQRSGPVRNYNSCGIACFTSASENSENSSRACMCVGKSSRRAKSNLESFHIICRGGKTNELLFENGQSAYDDRDLLFSWKRCGSWNFPAAKFYFDIFALKIIIFIFQRKSFEILLRSLLMSADDKSESILNVCCIECGMEIQIHTKLLTLSLYEFCFFFRLLSNH